MYLLSKLFTYIFLPPGIFILILLIATIYAYRFRLLFLLSAVSLYAISIVPVSNAILKPLESFELNETKNPQAIVILAGGANRNDFFKASSDAFKREVYGFYLAKEMNLPIVFSGKGLDDESKLAKEDFEKLSQLSNYKPKIYYENESLNTEQNAKFSAKLFEKLKMKKDIILVTSAYHMKRAAFIFKKYSFRVVTKPINKLIKKRTKFAYLPQMSILNNSYKAIHEYFGLFFYLVKELF